MSKFKDEIEISVKAGNGGPGAVSFRREKYVPFGGPDGGDGGRGGNVSIEASTNINSLEKFRADLIYAAGNGAGGQPYNRSGKKGADLILKVPPGTVVTELDGELIADTGIEKDKIVAIGGKGGKGNTHFKSSVKRTPEYAQPGLPGEEKRILLELKLIADVGFVGLPNSGKSTLLGAITDAHP
ncbi:MAG: GTPase ObgE, partial [Actinomycetia bacterium]|nr:GTPase ObgE [Actinomycetes bacterium]